jgi:hypothetical protein
MALHSERPMMLLENACELAFKSIAAGAPPSMDQAMRLLNQQGVLHCPGSLICEMNNKRLAFRRKILPTPSSGLLVVFHLEEASSMPSPPFLYFSIVCVCALSAN